VTHGQEVQVEAVCLPARFLEAGLQCADGFREATRAAIGDAERVVLGGFGGVELDRVLGQRDRNPGVPG
jgi:hypothetical protein